MAMLKFGVVSEIDPEAVTARVKFSDLDDMETMLIPVGQHRTGLDKVYWMPDVGEHVVCLLDVNAETGVVLCSIYSDADKPPVNDEEKRRIQFRDGTWIEYNRETSTLRVHCVGDIFIHSETHAHMSGPTQGIDLY